jgi:putative flippase GtrA
MKRWLKFNAVGFGGIILQLATLALLTSVLRLSYVFATVLAVEAAIIHNYLWHRRYTWADRRGTHNRFLKFNATTGAFSIAGNLGMMTLLVGRLHLPYLAANVISIVCCSTANFLVADRFVFAVRPGNSFTPASSGSNSPTHRSPLARPRFG